MRAVNAPITFEEIVMVMNTLDIAVTLSQKKEKKIQVKAKLDFICI